LTFKRDEKVGVTIWTWSDDPVRRSAKKRRTDQDIKHVALQKSSRQKLAARIKKTKQKQKRALLYIGYFFFGLLYDRFKFLYD